ncbi:MAG: YwaF family protein [Clostridia bacterium]|nr:YwaF family protein [Clostridia bacterium]
MFSPRDKSTACGMWSPTYVIALLVTLSLIAVALVLTRNISKKNVKYLLIGSSIFTISTEVVKMIFVGVTYGIEEVEFIPLYFCSLFMYSSVLATLKHETLRNTGLAFLFFGGIIGASAFFIYPSACIPNYPIYHFMCLRTMLYHGLMIYVGITVVRSGYYVPDLSHFKNYFVALSIVGIGAYVHNRLLKTNLMYISEPLDFALSKKIYSLMPELYPLIFMIAQIIVPFFISFGAWLLIRKINGKIKKG